MELFQLFLSKFFSNYLQGMVKVDFFVGSHFNFHNFGQVWGVWLSPHCWFPPHLIGDFWEGNEFGCRCSICWIALTVSLTHILIVVTMGRYLGKVWKLFDNLDLKHLLFSSCTLGITVKVNITLVSSVIIILFVNVTFGNRCDNWFGYICFLKSFKFIYLSIH